VDSSPHELRRQAEHCRNLADSQFDERVGSILRSMAKEFDRQAADLDSGERAANRSA
jgi:hypothetical protein